MKGFALYHNRKCVEIGLNPDTLLGCAWIAERGDPLPNKLLPTDIALLTDRGWKVRPIQFTRMVDYPKS